MRVAVFGGGSGDSREVQIAKAMAKGARRQGHEIIELTKIPKEPVGDVLISYGWIHELEHQLFSRYKQAGKNYVFVDLGYWGRSSSGFHRVSVNDWDSLHTLKTDMPDDRLKRSGLELRDDWDQTSKNIMVAGMSAKATRSHGYRDQQWEIAAAGALRNMMPGYSVNIRQKPRKSNHADSQPKITEALKSTYFVASHHSNVSVDCLWAGVPYFCSKGVGKRLSVSALTASVVSEARPPGRDERWRALANIAYVQYDLVEMGKGTCWDYIKGFLV